MSHIEDRSKRFWKPHRSETFPGELCAHLTCTRSHCPGQLTPSHGQVLQNRPRCSKIFSHGSAIHRVVVLGLFHDSISWYFTCRFGSQVLYLRFSCSQGCSCPIDSVVRLFYLLHPVGPPEVISYILRSLITLTSRQTVAQVWPLAVIFF